MCLVRFNWPHFLILNCAPILGDTPVLWILEMVKEQRHCIWHPVKDGLNVFTHYWIMELLFVLQLVHMGKLPIYLWPSSSLCLFFCWSLFLILLFSFVQLSRKHSTSFGCKRRLSWLYSRIVSLGCRSTSKRCIWVFFLFPSLCFPFQ